MNIKKASVFLVTSLIMVFMLGAFSAHAGNANIRFESDSTSADVGTNIDVRIEVEGDAEIAEFETAISYNPSVLTFVSGGDFVSGADGYLRLSDKLSSGGTTRSYTLTFTVAGVGDTEVTINGSPSIFDINYEEMAYAFAPVTISGITSVVASSDASLASIKLSPGTMEETFAPETTEYTINIPYENDFIVVNAVPTDDNAKVSITGVEGLKSGWNTGEITVTAEAGNTQTYTLQIYRMFEDEETEDDKSKENSEILQSKEQLIVVEEQGRVYLSNAFAYEIVELEDKSLIPTGYKKTKINLSGTTVPAYVLESNPKDDYVLLYAANVSTGDTNFYQYDKKENTIQRFNGKQKVASNSITVSEMTDSEYQKKITVCTIVIALLAALLAVTMVFAIKMLLRLQEKKIDDLDGVEDLDDIEDDEDDDDILN